MPLFRITDTLEKIEETSFREHGILERRTLQALLRDQISVVGEDLLVLAEEFGNWEDSRRRIDLLCIDKKARLAVIELKRTEDGGHMELQALRYAAMISRMTFATAIAAFREYLTKRGLNDDPEDSLLSFLGWTEPNEGQFASDVRIVLVSAEFSKELTTTVLWLNEYDLDVQCLRIKPYVLDGKVLIDVQRIVPLPEATEYQVRVREKEREERGERESQRDVGRFEVQIGQQVFSNLPKRRLAFYVISEAVKRGAKPRDILETDRYWIAVDGNLNEEKFIEAAEIERLDGSSSSETRRFYTDDNELFHVDGKTYALTRMWGASTERHVQRIIQQFNLNDVEYRRLPEQE